MYALAQQPDGKILAGGVFTSVNGITRRGVARLNVDGSIDAAFDPGAGAPGVLAVGLQPDGKILIGGVFTSFDGTPRNQVARLHPDGSLDMGFDPGSGAGAGVLTIGVQLDGKILVAGGFTSFNGIARNRIARLNADGSLDQTFDPGTGASSSIMALIVQPNGRVMVSGSFQSFNGLSRPGLVRLEANGAVDTGFVPSGISSSWPPYIMSMALQTDGKVLIGGEFTTVGGMSRPRIARLNPNGILDTSFAPGKGADQLVRSISLHGSGGLFVGGDFTTFDSVQRPGVAQIETGPLPPPNSAPELINLSNQTVPENEPVGTLVGLLTAEDPDADDTHVFELVAGEGDTDNALFSIVANELRTAVVFDYEASREGSFNTYTVRVRATDSGGLFLEDWIPIDILDVNEAPVAYAQSVTTAEDAPVAITLTGEDPDLNVLLFHVISGPSHGVVVEGYGDFIYTPNPNYHGPDSFAFVANDGEFLSEPATVSITVMPVNDAPVAFAQSVTTPEDTVVAITLTGSDVDGDSLTYLVVSGPQHGVLTGGAPHLTYTPELHYHGADSFTFRVSDGTLESALATVTIVVQPVNDAPVAFGGSVTTTEDMPVAILLEVADPDGDALNFTVLSGPEHGTLSGVAPALTYTPGDGFRGFDSFSFQASDGQADSNPATVAITVLPAGEPAADLTVLHVFGEPSTSAIMPMGRVVEGSDGALYGTSHRGGRHNGGTIYRVHPDGGGFVVLRDLEAVSDGGLPYAGLIEGSDGALYGTTSEGGFHDAGTIFRVQPDGSGFLVLRHLNPPVDGSRMLGALLEGSDGVLYGTASAGGVLGNGTVFRLHRNGTGFAVLHHLRGFEGRAPSAALIEGSDGVLYGTIRESMASPEGKVFRLTKDGSGFAVVKPFASAEGSYLYDAVVEGADGRLYGSGFLGGTQGDGTVWRMNRDGSGFAVLHHFVSATDGRGVQGLQQGTDGWLYGTTRSSGPDSYGTAFRIHPAGGFELLKAFGPAPDGSSPAGGVIEGSDGVLYGLTSNGGSSNNGTLYRLNRDGSEFQLQWVFKYWGGGAYPNSGVIEASDHRLYGTVISGGESNQGMVFSLNADGTDFQILRSLADSPDGANPFGPVIEGSDGLLYGTTGNGGTAGMGTVFRLKRDGTDYVVLKSFDGSTEGGTPFSRVLEGSDGILYGTTYGGGSHGGGTVWRMNHDGTGFGVLRHLKPDTDGSGQFGGLTDGWDGWLYGTAPLGGAHGQGTIFRLSRDDGQFQVLRHLDGASDGAHPSSRLLGASDGLLYGTTEAGGTYGGGTIYRIAADGTGFAVLKHLNPPVDGEYMDSVMEGPDGFLYGSTSGAGEYGVGTLVRYGTLFRLRKDGEGFETLRYLGLAATEPRYPWGRFTLGRDGRFYATSYQGGSADSGTVYAFSVAPANHAPTVILLSHQAVPENQPVGTVVGLFTADDPDLGDSHTFALVAGEGDTDNGLFSIVGNELRTAAVCDYEAQNRYSIRVRATDVSGLFVEAVWSVDVLDVNEAPMLAGPLPDLTATHGAEFSAMLAAAAFTDPDIGQTLTYSADGLPPGIGFDPASRTFGGVPTATGQYTVTVTATDNGEPALSADGTFVLSVARAPQVITFGALPLSVYGDAPLEVPVSASSGLPVTLTSSVASVATVSGTTLTITGAGTTLLTAYQAGDANHLAAESVQVSFTAGKGTPVITWATPADINCQTVLGAAQLNATVNAPGTLTYDPPAGTSLPLGEAQLLSVTFTPADLGNWNPASAATTIGVRLHPGAPPGQLDLSFDASMGTSGHQLRMIVVQPDGKAVVCGWFTSINGVARNEIARLNADGSLDLRFFPGTGASGGGIDAVALQPDGKVMVVGDFTAINGVNRRGIARLNPDGSVDAAFHPGTGANSRVMSVALQPDGKVLVGGWFTSVNGVGRNRIARLNSDGSVDTSFNPGAGVGDNYVFRVAVRADGKILITGAFTTVDGISRSRIARLEPGGALDSGFDVGTGANQDVHALALQPDGKVLVGGVFTSINGVSRNRLARLNDDGSVDTGFSPNVAGPVFAIAIQTDGRLLIGGNMGTVHGVNRMRVARLLTDGSVEASFDPLNGPDNQVRTVALQPDGKLLIGGDFSSVNSVQRKLIARLETGPAAPTITLHGPAAVTHEQGTPYDDPGAVAFDTCGSPLVVFASGAVNTSVAGTYTRTYVVTDAVGQHATATRTVHVVVSDHPPVALAGDDQCVFAGHHCVATVTVDGSASSDPDGDPIRFAWELFEDGELLDTVAGEAAVSWALAIGTYQARLTVFTDVAGSVVASSDTLMIQVLPSAPILAPLTPAAAYANGPAFELTVTGGCFLEGASVYWNGAPRPTTWLGPNELRAAIPASDLQTGVDIFVAAVQVVNGDGQVSDPLGFSIVVQSVGTVDATVSQPGGTTTVSTAPTTAGEPGATVTVENAGDQPVTVLAASYGGRPVGETVFQVDNGSFVDVQVVGDPATLANVSATVSFYYPSTVRGGMENRVKLRYFNGTNWIPVLSSGRLPPAKDTTDNLDGTISGGRFTVIFDLTSTPTILELGGTVFGMFESQPQLQAVYGPEGPVALGQPIEVSVAFAVLGDPDEVQVHFEWSDGTANAVIPTVSGGAGMASAAHLYGGPGVYPVIVRVVDAEGDEREGNFEYVVIYDPNGGFVTGGGWIHSPPGAYVFDATLAGRATFGFNSRYQKGRQVPTGDTQFQFQAAEFRFHSTAYDWLVVSGARAQYKGVGKVNNGGDYGFLLTATDGQVSGGGGIDRFRLKIWDRASGLVVYDNVFGAADDLNNASPQILGAGSIVIHQGK
ncbi:MAG: tandem-95 repeat protein [Verrucomicrobiae bacterium]|nr:tandem-95 repeat protein [Verrucomicrobiae bacterium]